MANVDEQVDALKQRLCRPASKLIVGGFRPPEDPYTSWFGKITLAPERSDWPVGPRGPMWPLCQLVIEHAPSVPESLRDFRMLQVFIDPEFYECDTDNGEGWFVRAIQDPTSLKPVTELPPSGDLRAFPCRWEFIEDDYPVYDDLPRGTPDDVVDRWVDVVETSSGTKIGGWPVLLQAEIYWAPWNKHPAEPQYVFQVDCEPKSNWYWGDRGVGYFGRATKPSRSDWAMSWQCL